VIGRAGTGSASAPTVAKSPLSNTTALLISRIAIAILSWAGTTVIVRSLDVDDWGRFSFVFSLLALASVLTDLGVGRIALGEVLPDQPGRSVAAGNYLLLRTGLGVIGYGLVIAFVQLSGYDTQIVRATVIGGAVLIFGTIVGAWNIAFQAQERLGHVAFSSVVAQLGQVALIVAISLRGGALLWFVAAAVVRDAVLLPWRAWRGSALLPVIWKLDTKLLGRMLREALPLSVGIILQTAIWRIDVIMLSKLGTLEDVGNYGVAYKFADLAHALPMAMSAALLAPMVKAWSSDRSAFGRIFTNSGRVLMISAGFAVVQMGLFAPDVIGLFFTDTYVDAALAGRLLMLAQAGAFPAALAFTTLVAAGRLVAYPIAAGLALLLNVGANLLLIPQYGFVGAAVATVVTEFVLAALLLATTGRLSDLKSRPDFLLGRVAVVSVFAAATGLGLVWLGVPWVVSMVAVTAVFLAAASKAGYRGIVQSFGRA